MTNDEHRESLGQKLKRTGGLTRPGQTQESAPPQMAFVLSGNLKEKPISWLLQAAEHYEATGRLSVGAAMYSVIVEFGLGRPINARSPLHKGTDAILELFTWADGKITFQEGVQPEAPTVEESVHQIIKQGEAYVQDMNFLQSYGINQMSILQRAPGRLSSEEVEKRLLEGAPLGLTAQKEFYGNIYGTLNLKEAAEKMNLSESRWMAFVVNMLKLGLFLTPEGMLVAAADKPAAKPVSTRDFSMDSMWLTNFGASAAPVSQTVQPASQTVQPASQTVQPAPQTAPEVAPTATADQRQGQPADPWANPSPPPPGANWGGPTAQQAVDLWLSPSPTPPGPGSPATPASEPAPVAPPPAPSPSQSGSGAFPPVAPVATAPPLPAAKPAPAIDIADAWGVSSSAPAAKVSVPETAVPAAPAPASPAAQIEPAPVEAEKPEVATTRGAAAGNENGSGTSTDSSTDLKSTAAQPAGESVFTLGVPESEFILNPQASEAVLNLLNRKETGIFSFDTFQFMLDREFARAFRFGSVVTLILFCVRLERDKSHSIPLSSLLLITEAVARTKREVDILGHVGDKGFGIILPNVSSKQACHLADRITVDLPKLAPSLVQYRPIIHFGIASVPQDVTELSELVAASQKAMLAAVEKNISRVQYHELKTT